MSSIEDRLGELVKRIDDLAKRLDRIEEGDVWKNTTLPFVIDTLGHDVDELLRDRYRWDDAYYEVFPERLEQDRKLREQLDQLKSSPPKPEDEGGQTKG